jgi:DNA (cytosine-5)-methyltransferase 1
LYWKVLNAKHHGVPQNRERVFLIGIRDDSDNSFQFPREEHLSKRLKDVLDDNVDDKYFLTEKGIEHIIAKEGVYTGINDDPIRCLTTRYSASLAGTFIKIKSATLKGYEEATEGDSINFSVPSSETRRGIVGKGVAQTLDTSCNQAVMVGDYRKDEGFRWREDGNSPCLHTQLKDIDFNEKRGQSAIFINNEYKIRRLTPRECFRLMDFPDTFTWNVSDSQAYKQAGNSIVVNVLYKILKQLPL